MNLNELQAKLQELAQYLEDTKIHLDPYDLKDGVSPQWLNYSLTPDLNDIQRRTEAVVRQLDNVIEKSE